MGSGSVCRVGQTLLFIRRDIAAAHADKQECLSYQNLATQQTALSFDGRIRAFGASRTSFGACSHVLEDCRDG
jgi:hypothetical protein